MEKISSFAEDHEEVDPPTYDWWVGAIPVNPDRPTTWHYIPVFCRNQRVDPPLREWKKLVADWYEHFPEPGPISDQFVWYFDVRHVQQWRTYWMRGDANDESRYSIFVQFDDNDKPYGRAIHFGLTPSQVNKVTLGAKWNQDTTSAQFGAAEGGVQVLGNGEVIFGTFAVLADGTFYIPADQQTVVGGKTYWKVKVGANDYGIELTPL